MYYLDWLLNPVTFYSGASICLLVSLGLFVNIKIEMARLRDDAAEGAKDSENPELRKLKAELKELRESVCRLEAERSGAPSAAGVDLTKRAQVIRMHRRGEPVSSIAAALETPSNEIALLLKVHAMTSQGEVKAG
jgi:hypothetical protein